MAGSLRAAGLDSRPTCGRAGALDAWPLKSPEDPTGATSVRDEFGSPAGLNGPEHRPVAFFTEGMTFEDMATPLQVLRVDCTARSSAQVVFFPYHGVRE